MQLPETVRLFRRNFRSQYRNPAIGVEMPCDRGLYHALQAFQALRMPAIRWVPFSIFRLRNDAAPRGRSRIRVASLVEGEQSERPERFTRGLRPRIALFRQDPGFKGIECNGKMCGGLRMIRILPRPPQPGPVDVARQAHRLQHPSVFGRQDTGPATAFLARFRDEPPRDSALFRRWIQLQRKGRGRPRVRVEILVGFILAAGTLFFRG